MITLYLAGKVDGYKWAVAKKCERRARFVATDYKLHCSGKYCGLGGDDTIPRDFASEISRCNGLMAWLDTHDSYGSIAEIAYASALGLPCRVAVVSPHEFYGGDEHGNSDDHGNDFIDAYWFVCGLPGVTVSDFRDTNNAEEWFIKSVYSMAHSDYLNTPAWRSKSAEAKRRANQRCQLCNAGGEIHTHHRTYERWGNEEMSDLVVLCESCHAKFHNKIGKP